MLSGAKQAQKLITSMMTGFVDSLKDIKKLQNPNPKKDESLPEESKSD